MKQPTEETKTLCVIIAISGLLIVALAFALALVWAA